MGGIGDHAPPQEPIRAKLCIFCRFGSRPSDARQVPSQPMRKARQAVDRQAPEVHGRDSIALRGIAPATPELQLRRVAVAGTRRGVSAFPLHGRHCDEG